MREQIPLAMVPPGKIVRIISINVKGRGPYRRLLELGLIPGSMVRVVSNALGPVVIEKNGARFAIGRGHASRIIVEVVG